MTLVVLPVRADQNDVKLSDLFRQLQSAPELTQAQLIERRIWDIWHTHTDPQVHKTMAVGVLSMRSGALKKALAAFDKIVAIDPNFAEGWNKRATIYYMMGRYTASVKDIQRALYLEPRHFGARLHQRAPRAGRGDVRALLAEGEVGPRRHLEGRPLRGLRVDALL